MTTPKGEAAALEALAEAGPAYPSRLHASVRVVGQYMPREAAVTVCMAHVWADAEGMFPGDPEALAAWGAWHRRRIVECLDAPHPLEN